MNIFDEFALQFNEFVHVSWPMCFRAIYQLQASSIESFSIFPIPKVELHRLKSTQRSPDPFDWSERKMTLENRYIYLRAFSHRMLTAY